MKLTEKDISTIRVVSQIAGIFTLIVAVTMIFSFVQLKTIDPLDNPALLELKEQYDMDPDNSNMAEQIRAMDLMARKAYFSSRRQIEIGSYLLLAGAVVFIFCQRLITGQEKTIPSIPGEKPDAFLRQKTGRQLILISASVITVGAIVSSFLLRDNLPETRAEKQEKTGSGFFANIFKGKKESSSEKNSEEIEVYTNLEEDFFPDGTNYPFFRGQDGRGIAGGSDYPTQWNGEDGTNIKWKIQVPKRGKSSPVIWGDKLFITGSDGLDSEVFCIDKETGNIEWSVSASGFEGEPSTPPEVDYETGIAASTAATNGESVAAIFANGNLICLDMNGNKKWAKNIGLPDNIYGYSCSLIMYDKVLIVQFDSNEKVSLIGFDSETGELKYETLRRGRSTWSSPVIATFNGEPQIIINGNPEVTAFDPATGNELWSIEVLMGDVAPSLAVNSRMVYAVTDYARLAAINPGPGPSIAWEDNMFTPDVSSPVANNNYLFLSTGNGDVACYNAMKGDTLWTRYVMDQFYASPVIADEKVYMLDRSGTMHILKAGSQYELLAESPIGEPADCTPAFSDKKIYIRGINNLFCISEN